MELLQCRAGIEMKSVEMGVISVPVQVLNQCLG